LNPDVKADRAIDVILYCQQKASNRSMGQKKTRNGS